jgi:hypothetical protein
MKIALCFSGQMRTGVQAEPNIKRYIGDLLSVCDVFVHTWDCQSAPMQPNEMIPVDQSVFADFYKLYNPISMTVEPYAVKQAPEDVWGGYRVDPLSGKKTVSMFESIYKANKLKREHEQNNNFVYDYVLRVRTDLLFRHDKTLEKDINEFASFCGRAPNPNSVFAAAFHKGFKNKLEDIFWIAPSGVMDQLAEFYTQTDGMIGDVDWQRKMAEWLIRDLHLGFYILKNSHVKILRPEDASADTLDPVFYNNLVDTLDLITHQDHYNKYIDR